MFSVKKTPKLERTLRQNSPTIRYMVLPGLLYTSYILYNDTIYPFILLVSGINK